MGVNDSRLRSGGIDPLNLRHSMFERALLEALAEAETEGSGLGSSEMFEHAWDPEDCSPRFRVLRDRLTARRLPSPLTTDCIRGKKGYRAGRHVWEILWEREERGSHAVVGVATPKAPLQINGFVPLVGLSEQSWGWDLVSKNLWHDGENLGVYPANIPGFVVPDSIYVVLDMDNKTLGFATKNIFLGVAFNNLPQSLPPILDIPLCPIVSAVFGNCDIKMKYMGRADDFVNHLSPITTEASSRPTPNRTSSDASAPKSATIVKSHEPVSVQPVEASDGYSFYQRNCGENIATEYGGKTAQRRNANNTFRSGVVLTEKPLQPNQMFEVRLDSKVTKWIGGVEIGATSNAPDKFNLPDTITNCSVGSNFIWSGKHIKKNGKEMTTLKIDLDDLSVGDRIGVMRMEDDSLHFYHNGTDVGLKVKTLPPVLYGVVDVYGTAEQVSITGGAVETQSSNEERTTGSDVIELVTVFVRMSNAVRHFEKPDDIKVSIRKVYTDILEPYMETSDRSLRQKYGDHLTDINAVSHLAKLLHRLEDIGLETDYAWAGIKVIRSVFWNYSDASMKFAKALGKCGLLEKFMKDLDRFGPRTSKNAKRKFIVTSSLNSLYNCAKARENRQIYRDLHALERIAPFVKAEEMDTAISAVLTLSYITEENKTHLLEVGEKVIVYLCDMLKKALEAENLGGVLDGDTLWSALELVMGLGNMAINENNRDSFVDQGVISMLVTLMKKGTDIDKECAANALWSLAKTERNKRKIREEVGAIDTLNKLAKSEHQGVQEAVKRVLLAVKITESMIQGSGAPPISKPRDVCKYRDLCKRFRDSLNVDGHYFNPQHDRCFCTECHASREDNLYYTRGEPAKDYGIPIGWCRFALQLHPRATVLKVFEKWHVAFHGTHADSISKILDTGDLCMPGDVVRGGRLSEADGHFNDERKPDGFDTKQIFVSPSIRYSGDDSYSKVKEYEDGPSGKTYNAKVALQLCIRPESYNVGPQTIGATSEIDPRFSNQEIEWFTKERGSTLPYGLLVKLSL